MSLRAAVIGSIAAASLPAVVAGVHGSQYAQVGTCGAYPRAPLETPKGACVGVVAGPDHGLKMPRTIIEVKPGEFILTDMGGWVGPNGRVLRLTVAADGKATVSKVYDNLYQPHGLAIGPDGQIYVGERGRISRFDPRAPGSAMQIVADNLPKDGLHPLTNMIFAADGSLIVNIGAPTDRCETKAKPRLPQNPCPVTQGDKARGALWRLSFDRPGGVVTKTEVLARGLRNSMALAVDPKTGALIQGENGVDLQDENEPAEELNIIKPGAHYGWPFCSGKDAPLPGSGVKKADCAKYEPAAVELPAHSAPLGMLVYSGAMFPELKGKLLIALHGYRQYGHRVIELSATALAANEKPAIKDVVSGWSRKRGVRPLGGPVGLAQASDGAIWIVEDKNRTVLVFQRDSGTARSLPSTTVDASEASPPPNGWDAFARDVVKSKCAACHVEARKSKSADIWAAMAAQGWVGEGPLADSKLARSLKGAGPEKPMPPPLGLKPDPKAKAAFERLLGANP